MSQTRDTTQSETFILEGPTEHCNQVRQSLVQRFEYIWLYVYTKSKTKSFITATNAFGGKLEKSLADEIILFAKTNQLPAGKTPKLLTK